MVQAKKPGDITTDKQVRETYGLNVRQWRFCNNLISGMTATEAYKQAGYRTRNDQTAASCASRMLRDEKIQEYLGDQITAAALGGGLTLEWWVDVQIREATGRVPGQKSTPASRSAANDRLGRFLGAFQADRQSDFSKDDLETLKNRLPEAVAVLHGGKTRTGTAG